MLDPSDLDSLLFLEMDIDDLEDCAFQDNAFIETTNGIIDNDFKEGN